ncbi:prolyl hydroxylase family protein [Novosphingobium album (ex Liu et al. 2023)]|uniref:2OG-Fe(II) oxygenase n=1 Tax=Novosphingobium album (ex Liu et al. 2023) TaxID=3031130 RepID=A0ABT5WW47_9SPHN|nr:2OG-Fe(II) oxygenase [Novosphingobium album (ex Liu et al. 2023)]MDE8654135.1 2OG-Fe(II) oxygenase [Novosphingobium album (ex Liu et al. 2023)]
MPAPNPDRKALATLGAAVRERLAGDPSVYKVPVATAEIHAVASFLSESECRHLIGLIDEVARPSELFDEAYREAYRTSYSGDVDQSDGIVRSIERRLSDLIGIDLAWSETVQGQRYLPGQEFRAHCDWFDTEAAYWPSEVARGGQRSWTAMAYLNDVEDGGVTEFPRIGVSIPPQAGSLILWNNATPDGAPNLETLHAALPVKAGVKYVITKWFRTRRWS